MCIISPVSKSKKVEAPKPLIFEVSWEVCSRVGGIYTVLRSKAPAATRRWGDDYWLIGPYRESASLEFEPQPVGGVIGAALGELRNRDVIVHTGRWMVSGRPRVMLVELGPGLAQLDVIKYFLWRDHWIQAPHWDVDFDQLIAFGHLLTDLLSTLHGKLGGRPMLAHFHEWQAGVALPMLRQKQVDLPTVFTTHATQIGRSLSAANVDLYTYLHGIGGEAVAREHNILHRYQVERSAAHGADVFTTVSGITGIEAEQFLGRAPEVVTPNGLNVERYAAPHQFQNLHVQSKMKIHEFVTGHFFPSYTFNLDKTIYIFTAGRYEYRNKGLDMFIESLYELNQRMKHEPNGMTVVAFIIAPAPFRGFNVDTLNRQAMSNELRQTCEEIEEDMGRKLFETVAHGRLPTIDDLLDESARIQLKRIMYAWQQRTLPAIVTHDMRDDGKDQVLSHLRHRNLVNNADDPVKVIFHPEFVSPTSPIMGMEYDDFVRGCHMGVFPSYYEPWGYTPMECVIRGIPAITTDLSGFGEYVMSHFPDHDDHGIYVAQRRGRGFWDTTIQIRDWLFELTRMTRRQRIQMRNRVQAYAEHFDWTNMNRYYRLARRMAFQNHFPDLDIMPDEPPEPIPEIEE